MEELSYVVVECHITVHPYQVTLCNPTCVTKS